VLTAYSKTDLLASFWCRWQWWLQHPNLWRCCQIKSFWVIKNLILLNINKLKEPFYISFFIKTPFRNQNLLVILGLVFRPSLTTLATKSSFPEVSSVAGFLATITSTSCSGKDALEMKFRSGATSAELFVRRRGINFMTCSISPWKYVIKKYS
jgi:hypothetical protein